MNLILEARQRANWLLALGRHIHRATGSLVAATIASLLVSQLALVLAMFLPLKVILLLATEGVPWYLRALISPENKDNFIVVLAVGALVAYGVHLLCEMAASALTQRAAARILSRSRKLSLFRDQDALVRTSFLRFCRLAASAIIAALAGCVGLYLETTVFVGLGLLLAAEFVVAHFVAASGHPAARALITQFETKQSRTLATLFNVNFLCAFVMLFVEFLAGTDRNVIVAIVSFLLLRQVNNRARIALGDFIGLSNDKHRINPLFYSKARYTPPTDGRQMRLLRMFALPERERWIRAALTAVTGEETSGIIETRWNDTGNAGIAAFDVIVTPENQPDIAGRRTYFLRCFAGAQRHLGEHEASLFESGSAPACAPHYIGRDEVAGLLILVYHGLPAPQPDAGTFARLRPEILRDCEDTALAPTLLKAHLRTHRTLPQRMDANLLQRITPALRTDADHMLLQGLLDKLPIIAELLSDAPVLLRAREIDRRFCRIGNDGRIHAWSWHRWGADIPVARPTQTENGEQDDPAALRRERDQRVLAARVAELETALTHYNAAEALAKARALHNLLDRLKASETHNSTATD